MLTYIGFSPLRFKRTKWRLHFNYVYVNHNLLDKATEILLIKYTQSIIFMCLQNEFVCEFCDYGVY